MKEPSVTKAIEDLRTAARQLRDAIGKVNQLPDQFPTELVAALIDQVEEVEGDDEDSVRIAVHLRDKVLQTIEFYKGDDSDGAPRSGFLKTLHNEMFVEVSRFLSVTRAAERYPQLSDIRRSKTLIRSDDYEQERQALLEAATQALREAKHAHVTVQNFVQQNGLVNIGGLNFREVEFTFIKVKKAIAGLSLELKSTLIDLHWASEFVGVVSKAGEYIAAVVKRMDQKFRAAAIGAIDALLDKTFALADQMQKLVRRSGQSLTTPPVAPEMRQAPPVELQGVRIGQRYAGLDRRFWGTALEASSIEWTVEGFFQTRDGLWHARISSELAGTKTLAVSGLADVRMFRLVSTSS